MILLLVVQLILLNRCVHGLYYSNIAQYGRVIKEVFDQQDPKVIPAVKGKPITVYILPSITEIYEFDDLTQTLNVEVQLWMRWNNKFTTWLPTKYIAIKNVTIMSKKIWTPNFVPSRQKIGDNDLDTFRAFVTNKGDTQFNPRFRLTMRCKRVDWYNFPRDKIICKENITSDFLGDYFRFNFMTTKLDENRPESTGDLKVLTLSVSGGAENSIIPAISNFVVSFQIMLQRDNQHHEQLLIIPVIMALLIPLSYLIPIHSHALHRFVLLTVTVGTFLNILSSHFSGIIPTNISETPRIIKGYIGCFALNVGAIAWTAVILNLWFYKHNKETPSALKTILVDKLGSLTMLPTTIKQHNFTDEEIDASDNNLEDVNSPATGGKIEQWQLALLSLDRCFGMLNVLILIIVLAA